MAFNESEDVILANRAFSTTFGLERASLIGKNILDLPTLAGLIPEIQTFLRSRSLSSRTEFQYRYNGYNKTFVASFARLNEDKISFLVLTDVSEERARQERLYLTDRLASVGEMASGIAHELNNPLTSVIGLSQILSREDMPEDFKADLTMIHSEAQRAAAIVKNMLSFARKHAPQKQYIQINRVVEDVLKLRTYEHTITGITIEKGLDPDLPEVLVDYFQMQQVFINIILNAEQAMADTKCKGRLKITSERVDGIIKVSFSDNGPGIAPQHLGRIFDPFFTTKDVGKGTGLGLSISYGIVTAHNGTIYARNENGRGATFIVELPIQSSSFEEIPDNVKYN
jgi:signal transduction histidine kinase